MLLTVFKKSHNRQCVAGKKFGGMDVQVSFRAVENSRCFLIDGGDKGSSVKAYQPNIIKPVFHMDSGVFTEREHAFPGWIASFDKIDQNNGTFGVPALGKRKIQRLVLVIDVIDSVQ